MPFESSHARWGDHSLQNQRSSVAVYEYSLPLDRGLTPEQTIIRGQLLETMMGNWAFNFDLAFYDPGLTKEISAARNAFGEEFEMVRNHALLPAEIRQQLTILGPQIQTDWTKEREYTRACDAWKMAYLGDKKRRVPGIKTMVESNPEYMKAREAYVRWFMRTSQQNN